MHEKDIRVLMMLDAFDIGGTETHVLSLTRELLKKDVSVFVAGDSGPLKNFFKMLPCKIYSYKNKEQEFETWIRNNDINLIHAHLESSGSYAVHLSQKLNIPLIYTVHGTYYDTSRFQKLLHTCTISPLVISVSVPVKKWLETRGIHSTYIPNGIDMNEFNVEKSNLREKLNIPGKSKVILYASRLEDEKYKICKLLLNSFENKLLKRFPKAYLLIAGGGMKSAKIKKIINEQIKSNRIQYIGNRIDMPDLYSICNYVVGTGRVALEAIFCERPVIAIGTAGTFGLVKPDNLDKALTYYFGDHKCFQPLNQTNVTNAVKKGLLFKDPNSHFSKLLRHEIQQQFEISLVTNKICNLYKGKLRKEEGL